MSVISERAMLATVHISVWTARKHDRTISKEVAANHGADERAGRYHKRLFLYADKLDNIQTIAGRIRSKFYKYSLPWSDEGFRILPKEVYFEFTQELSREKEEFWNAVNSFLDNYPAYIEDARLQQGTLFRESDYPAVESVRRKFDLKFKVNPMPAGDDFRVELSEAHKDMIRAEIDADVRETVAGSTRDLFNRAYEVVQHMASRLGDPEAVFRNTTITNVSELADLLPRLNITHDPVLDKLAAEMKEHLCIYSPSSLRDNHALRSATAAKAHTLARRIGSAMGEEAAETSAEVVAPVAAVTELQKPETTVEAQVDSLMQRLFPYMEEARPAA